MAYKYTQIIYPYCLGEELLFLPNSTNKEDIDKVSFLQPMKKVLIPKIGYIPINQQDWNNQIQKSFMYSYQYLKEIYKKSLNLETNEGLIDYLKYLTESLLEKKNKKETWHEYYKLNTKYLTDIEKEMLNDLINPIDYFNRSSPIRDKLMKGYKQYIILVPYPESLLNEFPIINLCLK